MGRINTRQLVDGAVTNAKIADGTIQAAKLAAGIVGGTAISDTNNYYTTDTITGATDALGVQIGGDTDTTKAFSEQNYVTNDDVVYDAIDKLDVALKDRADDIGTAQADIITAQAAADANTLKTAMLTRETAGAGGKIELLEATANGVQKVTIQSPAALTGNRTISIPDANVDLSSVATMVGSGVQAVGVGDSPAFLDVTFGTVSKFMGEDAAASGRIRLGEDSDNGASYVEMAAPAALTGNKTITLPDADVDLTDVNTMAGAAAQNVGTDGTPAFPSVTFATTSKLTGETAGAGGTLWLAEATANGVNKVIIASPVALGGDRTITIPDADVTLSDLNTMAGSGVQAVGIGDTPAFGQVDIGTTSKLKGEAAGAGAYLALAEATANGVQTVVIQPVAALTGDRTVSLPDADVDLADVATQAAQIAALGAENTDGQMVIPILAGVGDAGTWTKAITSGGLATVTRTASAAAESYWIEIPIENRTTASKGIKPTGLRVNYTVATADLEDVRFELWAVTQGADNAARTAAVIVGQADADYDGDHNTAGERGDDTTNPELHLAIVTDAAGAAYLSGGQSLMLRVFVDGDAGGAGIFVLTNAILAYSETLVDLA